MKANIKLNGADITLEGTAEEVGALIAKLMAAPQPPLYYPIWLYQPEPVKPFEWVTLPYYETTTGTLKINNT